MADELPVLVAALTDEQTKSLDEASRLGRHVWVDLKWPPGAAGPHLLEVYTPTSNVPLRLLAEPLGTTNEAGHHALRLYPWEEQEKDAPLFSDSNPAPTPDSIVGRKIANGRFEVLSVVGEGSIGAVYRARHMGLGIVVAVKVLHEAFQRDAEFSRRFYAEALALSRLDHPNLVHIYDFGQESDGLLYLSMAFVDGQTLRTILNRERRLEVPRVVAIMLQVCAGLGHAHARGLIHRDVKQDNVMIVRKEDDDGNVVENVKVLDFGFAIPPSVSADVAQRLAGTPVYMSPEQCLGEELDARSDVYACGVMIYELVTGRVPFLANSAAAIRQMHIDTPPPLVSSKVPNVDPRLDRLVQRALAKSRDDRQQNMQELRAELKLLLLPEGTPASAVRTTGSFDRLSINSMPAVSVGSAKKLTPQPLSRPSAPAPEWMETRQEGYARFMEEARQAQTPAHSVADMLAKDASTYLGELAHERDERALAKRLVELDGAIRVLAQRGDARTLQMVNIVISGLSDRAFAEETAREGLAALGRMFSDPDLLAPLAKNLLTNEDANREAAAEILADARVAGAYALYGARTKIAADQRARIAFVKTMKSLGEFALPVVRAALERIYDGAIAGANPTATEVAEDLLLSMPNAPDEVAGHLVMKYAGSPIANLCRAAARALPRVWTMRAQPVLAHLLEHHEDDSVRLAAIVGLREIGGVDGAVVNKVAALIAAGKVRTEQMRAATVAALRSSTDARAVTVLAQLEG